MPAAVYLNRELCRRTTEINYITIDWMLTAKFVPGKISISQMTPKNSFSSCRLFSEQARAIHETSVYCQNGF